MLSTNRPRLILADEPTAALDEKSGKDVCDMLKHLAEVEQATVLVVTHDNRILHYVNRILNMVDGRIASDILVGESLGIFQLLKACLFFEERNADELTEISQKCVKETFGEGDLIIRQGDEGDKFYVLRDGTVDVIVEIDGEPKKVDTMGTGDSFGETALLTGKLRNATIRAATDVVEVYSLDKASFNKAIGDTATFDEQLRERLFNRR